MKFVVYETYQDLCKEEAHKISETILQKPTAMLCLAAGHSSLGIFKELIKLYHDRSIDFSKSKFVAMDEWKGMSIQTQGSCSDFLSKNFISHVNFTPQNVRYVNGTADDFALECQEISHFIYDNNGIDYLLLGVGMNGHLALNEPGVDFLQSVHETDLDDITKQVGTKYFENKPVLIGGITIGIADIIKSRQITLCVNGENKASILKQIMTLPVSNQIPATIIKTIYNSSIICDKLASRDFCAIN